MRNRLTLRMAGLAVLVCSLIITLAGVSAAADFANPAFNKVWSQTDLEVKQGKVARTWIWGPEPGATTQEPYTESPGGQRLVQYFDKSRMEINNPNGDVNSIYYVTNGLLAKELVSGQMQTGDKTSSNRGPAQVPVGGDPDNDGPTYATFAPLASLNNDKRAEKKSGFVNQNINRAGQIGTTTVSANYANYAYYDDNLGHNIPDVFYGQFLSWKNTMSLDWVYVVGLPMTEPFWAKFKVAGVDKEVLVQIYERRALTFTPGNSPGFLVEMGNIGQHYYKWRYGSTSPNTTAAAQTTTVTPNTTFATNPANTTAPATTAVPSTTAVPATTAPATTAAPTNGLDAEESQFLTTINQYRASKGLAALQLDTNLTTAAKWMSADMANNNRFSHTDSQGRDMGPRLTAFGYTRYPQGENIAAGYTTAALVFDGWKNSSGHNANMLGADYKYIGIGRAYNASSTYKWYWTIDLGG